MLQDTALDGRRSVVALGPSDRKLAIASLYQVAQTVQCAGIRRVAVVVSHAKGTALEAALVRLSDP